MTEKEEFSLRIEFQIVGGMLRWPKYIGEAAELLSPNDFTDSLTRAAFAAIVKLFMSGAPVNEITVLKEMGSEYSEFVHGLYSVGDPQVGYYSKMLLERNKLAAVQTIALNIAQAHSLEEAQPLINELIGTECHVRGSEPSTLAKLVAEYLTERNTAQEPDYLKFGISGLDELIFSEPGDFLLIGATPSLGKTLLALQCALEMSKTLNVGFFSLETGKKKLTSRMISTYTGISLRDIKLRKEQQEDVAKIVQMGHAISERSGSLSVHRLRNASVKDIRALTLRYRYDVIIVDYIQLLRGPGRSRYEQITNISTELRNLSPEDGKGVIVIGLAQLSRPEKVGGKVIPPDLSSLKESGQLEADADIVMLLYRADEEDKYSPRILKVAKNKDGELGEIYMDFDGTHQRMTPMTPAQVGAWREMNAKYKQKKKSKSKGQGNSESPEEDPEAGQERAQEKARQAEILQRPSRRQDKTPLPRQGEFYDITEDDPDRPF